MKSIHTLKIHLALFVFCMLGFNVFSQPRTYRTNTNYQQGDWITYSVTRFVRDIAIGYEFIFFATTGGITRYNFYSNSWEYPWTVSNGLASNNINSVTIDFNTGYLWCSTDNSISYLEPATQYWNNAFYDEIGLMHGDIVTAIAFGEGNVYILTRNGDWFVSDPFSASFVRTTSHANDDTIKGLGNKMKLAKLPHFFMPQGYIFDETSRIIDDLQLRKFDITTWISDEWQNMWMATWGLGAARGNLATLRLELLEFGLWDYAVDAIAVDEDQFWIGGIQENSRNAAITAWDMSKNNLLDYYESNLLAGFANGEVTSIAIDERLVWIGTHDGLTRYDRQRDNWRTYTAVNNLVDNWVNDVIVDDRFVYIATAGGVDKLDKRTVFTDSLSIRHINYPKLGTREIFDLDQSDTEVWVGSEVGLFVYEKETGKGSFYASVADPVSLPVYALSFYNGELWYGTERGVAAFNTITGERFDPPARLDENLEINKILSAKDAVWVATNSGVFKFDRQDERWVQFTMEDGLPSDNVFALHLQGDYIWFGTDQGLTRFYWNAPYRIDY